MGQLLGLSDALYAFFSYFSSSSQSYVISNLYCYPSSTFQLYSTAKPIVSGGIISCDLNFFKTGRYFPLKTSAKPYFYYMGKKERIPLTLGKSCLQWLYRTVTWQMISSFLGSIIGSASTIFSSFVCQTLTGQGAFFYYIFSYFLTGVYFLGSTLMADCFLGGTFGVCRGEGLGLMGACGF